MCLFLYTIAKPDVTLTTVFHLKDMEMKAFIELMVKALVDHPDKIRVDEEPGEMSTTYRVHVAPSDRGQAIGKQGRIANAMRVLAKASAIREKRRVYLKVVGDDAAANPDVTVKRGYGFPIEESVDW